MSKSRNSLRTRFLSDFTLGFSDGLTVPFALTAGLSSLGRSETVICAGLAEICAGSVSMGIGGYLSARVEMQDKETVTDHIKEEDKDPERQSLLGRASIHSTVSESMEDSHDTYVAETIRDRLQSLGLSSEMMADVMSVVKLSQHDIGRAATPHKNSREAVNQPTTPKPFIPGAWFSGLSISIGYVTGGLIPLLPYFITSTVGDALRWSIALCLMALFIFGFSKNMMLTTGKIRWSRSTWEGVQMLLLGGVAAAVAVVMIKVIDTGDNEPGL